MTACTICGLPAAGHDDDDEACCLACLVANFAGVELRPPASVTRACRPRPWRRDEEDETCA